MIGADATTRAPAAGWLLRGWPRSDLLALAAVVAAILIAVVPPLRRGLVRGWRLVLLRLGLPRLRYARWFVRMWGVYENPYLDDKENLDLSNTFVPLSFHSEETGRETLDIATGVLANRKAGNLVIDGVPGSGKSTLLRAFGVGVLRAGHILARREQDVPFLIQLRKLARYRSGQVDIADYIINEILVSSVGMKSQQARQFLRYSLVKDRVLVMLDGLDEVTADLYRSVHEAVYGFMNDHRPDCPSYRARIIVTCRTQNFLSIRDEWIPAIAATVCSLAPLRNSEIFSYLDKLRTKFRAPGGPESFIQAVRVSGTLDLHRVPLILAMSVGLYARKDYFEIPSSIARLYRTMIEEMLDRHRFKRDPIGVAVFFQLGDKYRFLREFALHAASRPQGFDEFTRADLVAFASSLAHDLDAVSDPEAFVAEIVERSGLLTDVGETGLYVFAHRSIQEFLAADELRLTDGGSFLLSKGRDAEWRQVIQFYAASLEQRQANAFLPPLSQYNKELAGYCLAVAKASDDVAGEVLDALQPLDGMRLAALAAATMSPRVSVQQMAISHLQRALSSPSSRLPVISGDVDALLPLLGSLAGANAAEIAGLVPQIIEHLPDDPRLVEPLWRCLSAQGIERLPASRAIVERLLSLVTNPDGFDELARQESYTRTFLSESDRRRAYPFVDALPIEHNLATLLAWADYLHITPREPNRYFEAKAAARLDRVEADRRRTVTFSPYWPARIYTLILALAGTGGTAALVVTDPHRLTRPFGWWNIGLVAAAAVAPFVVFAVIGVTTDNLLRESSRFKKFYGLEEKTNQSAHVVAMMNTFLNRGRWMDVASGVTAFVVVPFGVAVVFLPFLGHSLLLYMAVTLVIGYLYWLPTVDGCSYGRHYYLYRPNPYIDVYDDPRSRHWVETRIHSGNSSEQLGYEKAGTPARPVG